MRLPIPSPGGIVRLAEGGYEALERAIALVPRMAALVGTIERIVAEIDVTEKRAAAVVTRVDTVAGRASGLVDRFGPVLERAEPILTRLVDTTSTAEVDAIVHLVDMLPDVVDHFGADIMPILDTLRTVAPDLRDLLDVSRELNEILGSIPGFGRIKRRIEEEQREQDDHRARLVE